MHTRALEKRVRDGGTEQRRWAVASKALFDAGLLPNFGRAGGMLGCTSRPIVLYRWRIGWTYKEHNHLMNPDPFTYQAHRNKKLGHNAAIATIRPIRGEISYLKASRILQK